MDTKVGQKVKNTLTGRGFRVNKILRDNSVVLISEEENACTIVNKDQMDSLFDELDSESLDISDSG
jgi:hypothetical protein